MPDLSIIIVNWNTRDLLIECLNSILSTAADLAVEIIVVDNASTDGSPAVVQRRFPEVRLIGNVANIGFAKANNQAMAISQGRYFLLLNSDTVVLPRALGALVRFADEHSKAGVVGCKLLNADGSLQESWASFPAFWSEVLGRNFRNRPQLPGMCGAYEVDWVGGACLLVRSAAIQQVGMLDENYFMYSEETDWCFRIKRAGWKVYYLANAEITHLGGGSASRTSPVQLIRLYESKIRFFRQHYGVASASLLRHGLVIANVAGLARHGMRWLLWANGRAEISRRLGAQWKLIRCLVGRQPPEGAASK